MSLRSISYLPRISEDRAIISSHAFSTRTSHTLYRKPRANAVGIITPPAPKKDASCLPLSVWLTCQHVRWDVAHTFQTRAYNAWHGECEHKKRQRCEQRPAKRGTAWNLTEEYIVPSTDFRGSCYYFEHRFPDPNFTYPSPKASRHAVGIITPPAPKRMQAAYLCLFVLACQHVRRDVARTFRTRAYNAWHCECEHKKRQRCEQRH